MSARLGFSVPILGTRGGAGLGNEAIAWGKALIGAAELGLVACHPPWALNRRGYRGDFGTSRLDWVAQRALRAVLPVEEVTAADVLAAPGSDYADLIRSLRPRLERRRTPYVLAHASGMTGGFLSIRPAREALASCLSAPAHVPLDLVRVGGVRDARRALVAVHVRGGDFIAGAPLPGQFNRRLPVSWYASAVRAACAALGADRVQVAVVGDELDVATTREIVGPAARMDLPPRRRPLLTDLALLASADLLVCSVSSFSMLAAFLGDANYAWYGPHLASVGGWRAIWVDDPAGEADAPWSLANASIADAHGEGAPRGFAHDQGDALPDHVVATLESALVRRDPRTDLVHFGVVR
jgi:hypothetical protein